MIDPTEHVPVTITEADGREHLVCKGTGSEWPCSVIRLNESETAAKPFERMRLCVWGWDQGGVTVGGPDLCTEEALPPHLPSSFLLAQLCTKHTAVMRERLAQMGVHLDGE